MRTTRPRRPGPSAVDLLSSLLPAALLLLPLELLEPCDQAVEPVEHSTHSARV